MSSFEDEEALRFAFDVGQHAKGEIPPEGYLAMGINDYIATTTRLIAGVEAIGAELTWPQKVIDVLAYLRDGHAAQSMGDAINLLKTGQVDPKIVELWIEEGYLTEEVVLDPIKEGYPDKLETLEEAKAKADEDLRFQGLE